MVTSVSQAAAVNDTHFVLFTKSGPPKISRIMTKVDVAAGIVANTIKTTDATSTPQSAKKPQLFKHAANPFVGIASARLHFT